MRKQSNGLPQIMADRLPTADDGPNYLGKGKTHDSRTEHITSGPGKNPNLPAPPKGK